MHDAGYHAASVQLDAGGYRLLSPFLASRTGKPVASPILALLQIAGTDARRMTPKSCVYFASRRTLVKSRLESSSYTVGRLDFRWCSPVKPKPTTAHQMMQRAVCGVPVRSWLNLVAFLVNLGITYGSLTGAFGKTNQELSEKYQTLITPAGYAFSIWGIIFIWEGVFAIAQMFPSLAASPVVATITPWWILACCFQVAWTFFFAQELIPGSLVCMLGILGSLLTGILRTDLLPEISLKEYFLLRAPFSVHAGWIIAASALNTNVLVDFNRGSQATLLMFAMVPCIGWRVVPSYTCQRVMRIDFGTYARDVSFLV